VTPPLEPDVRELLLSACFVLRVSLEAKAPCNSYNMIGRFIICQLIELFLPSKLITRVSSTNHEVKLLRQVRLKTIPEEMLVYTGGEEI